MNALALKCKVKDSFFVSPMVPSTGCCQLRDWQCLQSYGMAEMGLSGSGVDTSFSETRVTLTWYEPWHNEFPPQFFTGAAFHKGCWENPQMRLRVRWRWSILLIIWTFNYMGALRSSSQARVKHVSRSEKTGVVSWISGRQILGSQGREWLLETPKLCLGTL